MFETYELLALIEVPLVFICMGIAFFCSIPARLIAIITLAIFVFFKEVYISEPQAEPSSKEVTNQNIIRK